MKYYLYILFSIYLLFPIIGNSQRKIVRFDALTAKEGLSNDWVNCIVEDDQGFIWAGTRSGLNLYEGTINKIFYHEPSDSNSLSGNDISHIINSKHGMLIVATWGDGLNFLNPKTQKIERIGSDIDFKNLTIKQMIEDKDSIVWIGTYDKGFFKFDVKTRTFESIDYAPDLKEKSNLSFTNCETMCYFNDTIWVGGKEGVGYIDKADETIKPIKLKDQENLDIDRIGQLNLIYGIDSLLLFGNSKGDIYVFNLEKRDYPKKIHFAGDEKFRTRVTTIFEERDGILWVSTSSGAFEYNIKTKEIKELLAPNKSGEYSNNFCSFKDSRGIIWIGTWGNGLFEYNYDNHKFKETFFPDFETNNIKTLVQFTDTELLLGTNKGLLLYNQKTDSLEALKLKGRGVKNLMSKPILSIAPYKDKFLIAVDGIGLFILENNGQVTALDYLNEYVFSKTFVYYLEVIENDQVWLSTWSDGLFSIDVEEQKYINYKHNDEDIESINSNIVYKIFKDNNGTYWIGNKEGLSTFDPISRVFTSVSLKIDYFGDIIDVKEIREIKQGDKNILWLATAFGILKYNTKDKTNTLLTVKDGLLDPVIVGMIKDDKDIWCLSNKGLAKVDTKTHEIDNFSVKDGLLSNNIAEHAILKSTNGNIYLGNEHEMIYFNSDISDKNSKTDPSFFINDVIVNGETLSRETYLGDHSSIIELEASSNVFFEITCQNYLKKADFFYGYKLKGIDKEWDFNDLNDTKIKYTNLRAGKYELIIGNADKDGNVFNEVTHIKFVVLKHFWQEWWFILLCIIIGGILIYLILMIRTKDIVSKNQALESKVLLRTEEIRAKSEELVRKNELAESNVRYASLIQESLFPKSEMINQGFDNHFIFNKPKDIVSGDFYWFAKVGSKNIFAVSDCTGHGVSGAFVSVLGVTALKSIVELKEVVRPDLILKALHTEIKNSLNKQEDENDLRDGMDISIISYDEATKELQISAAMSSILVITEDGKTKRIRGSRSAIGGSSLELNDYSLTTMRPSGRTMVYLYSDGYKDQFGGAKGKKYMQKNFRELLIKNSKLSIKEQLKELSQTFYDWKGEEHQVDDVLVVGLEIDFKK